MGSTPRAGLVATGLLALTLGLTMTGPPLATATPLPQAANAGEFTIKATKVNTSATGIVLAENMFNDSPPPGSTYVLVTLRLKRIAAGSGGPWLEYDFQLLPTSGAFIDEEFAVIPNDLSDLELFQGRSGTGNIVFIVPKKKLKGLKLRVSYYDSSFNSRELYLNLT